MRSNRTMMFAGVIGLMGAALAASAPMVPGGAEDPEPGSAKYNPRRASGSKPVPGGGAKERAKRLARMMKKNPDGVTVPCDKSEPQ